MSSLLIMFVDKYVFIWTEDVCSRLTTEDIVYPIVKTLCISVVYLYPTVKITTIFL